MGQITNLSLSHGNPNLKLQASPCYGQLPSVQWFSTSMLWSHLPSYMNHFQLKIMTMRLCSVPLYMNALFPPFAMDSLKTLDLYALQRVLSRVLWYIRLCCNYKYMLSWCRLYHLFLKFSVFPHCGCFMMCHSS